MDAVDADAGNTSSTPECSQKWSSPTIMWSSWTEDRVPRSMNGCKIHSRWYVIETKIYGSLQAIKTKLTLWSNNVDLSEDTLKNWYPNLILGTTVQSMNKGNFCYLALKNVSHQAPRESFLNLLQDLQREFKVEITTGWVRWLTGENEDMQFDIRKTGLAVLLLGSVTDQIRSSVRPTKIPWAETSETILLNISLALTEDELLVSSLEEEMLFPTPQQNCITRSKDVYHSVDQVDSENVQKTSIKTEPTEHDTEHDEPFTPSPDLFQSYDERCSAIAAPPPVTDYHRVNNTASNHHSCTVRTVKKEASPDTLWSSSIPDFIHKKNGFEIHGRWYILQIMTHDRQESIIAELKQWARNIDLNTEFLRNWNPKLTLGITVESSSQNYSYCLILKNVSSRDIRTSFLHLMEDLKHQQRISVSTGWVRWLTGPKKDCQLDMYISSLKLLLQGTAKEQTLASILTSMPWLEEQTVLLFDILLCNVALKERQVSSIEENNSVIPSARLTHPAVDVNIPVTMADKSTKSARTEIIEIEQENLCQNTQVNGQIRGGSAFLKIRCQCGSIVGVPGKEKFCNECGLCLYTKCSSCGEELPWNYKHCNMCGGALNSKDESPATARPASGRPVTQNIVTPSASASPPSGHPVTHNNNVTPHTSTPTLTASVQASTSSQNDAQISQFSQNNTLRSQHRPFRSQTSQPIQIHTQRNSQFRSQTSQPGQNNIQLSQHSQFRTQTSQPMQIDTQRDSQFCSQTSQPMQINTQRDSQFRSQTLQPGQNNIQLSQHSQFRTQTSQPMQIDTQRDSQFCSQTLQPGQNDAQISQHSQFRSQTSQPMQIDNLKDSQFRSQTLQPGQNCSERENNIQYRARIPRITQAGVQISQSDQVLWTPTYEAKLLRDLQQHHYTGTGIHVHFTVISRNPLTVQCSVCNITVNAGSIEQQFPNLRYHLSDNIHNFNLSMLEDEDPVNAIFGWIAGIYKNQFLLKTTFAVCRCDKAEISLLPDGNPYHAIHAHINSKKHKNASERFVDSKDITIYCKIRKIK